jgi:para-nitrobenzyl esterase
MKKNKFRLKQFAWKVFSIGALCTLFGCGGDSNSENTQKNIVLRPTKYGSVIGNDDSAKSGTYFWKGIPFAQPPVSDLRWRAPAEPVAWTQPRNTKAFGNACAQISKLTGPGENNRYDESIGTSFGKPVGNEDCLYLNIWRPATDETNLPVLVFVHGGGNTAGYTADPLYDGAQLAKKAKAIVVTLNYRLGIFGFISMPQLKNGKSSLEDSGNFALLDIKSGLGFVRDNISNFGGNPQSVTLMGQSAGAINVYAMLTSPAVAQSKPALFHRVVAFSGGLVPASELPTGIFPTLSPASVAATQGQALLTQQVIADGLATDTDTAATYIAGRTPAQITSYLRSKSSADLLTTIGKKLIPLGLGNSSPIPDGSMVAVNPVQAIRNGNFARVPVWASNTAQEMKSLSPLLIPPPLVQFDTLFKYKPDAPATVKIEDWIPANFLPVTQPDTGYNAVIQRSDFFVPNQIVMLNSLKAQNVPTWYSRFEWAQQPAPWNEIYEAAHALELPFLFGNFNPWLFSNVLNSEANKPGRLELSDAVIGSLSSFARVGDPNTSALGVQWPTWPSTLKFDATLTQKNISVSSPE